MSEAIAKPVEAKMHRDAARYVLSGCGAAGVDFSSYTVLVTSGGLQPEQANLISRPLGGLASFLLHKFFTFENRGKQGTHVQLARFWVVWFFTFWVSQGLVVFYHQVVHFGPLLTKVAAEGGAGVLAFICQRFWTFR